MERFINRLDSSHSEEPIESIEKIGRENLEGALIPKQLHLFIYFFTSSLFRLLQPKTSDWYKTAHQAHIILFPRLATTHQCFYWAHPDQSDNICKDSSRF